MNKEEIEKLAEAHIEEVWGGYKDDVFKHDDIITDLTLADITKHDFVAGYKAALKLYNTKKDC